MPEIYRAFIFVSVMAIPAFVLAQLATRSFVDRSEATLWRNCWFFTTAAVFLSGNFLVFTALMIALSIYVHKSSRTPYYLYFVLLMTGPVVGVIVGIPGVMPTLLDLNPARVMVLVFLLPTAYRLAQAPQPTRFRAADVLISLYLLLVIVLSLRHGSPTHMLRIALVTIVDIGVPYFVFSRSLHSTEGIRRALAAFLFGVLPFALAGMFEFARGWRTYNAVIESWGVYLVQAYLFRDGLLRAAATAIEPIAFGFVCMVGLGVLLANMSEIRNKLYFWGAGGILAGGLAASLSRGPWLGAVLLLIVFAATTRRGFLNVVKLTAVAAVLCVPLAFSPVGERIYRLLPFVGSVEKSNEDYRSRLIDISAIIVARNPLFGSARYVEEPEMQELVQGQGIVDIVNSYIAVALEFGLVGAGLFVGFFLSIGLGLYRACFRTEGSDAILMRALTATLASMLLTIGTVSSVATIPYIYWSFAGVCVAALRLGQTSTVKPKLNVLGYTG
jgi:hypothetical protein